MTTDRYAIGVDPGTTGYLASRGTSEDSGIAYRKGPLAVTRWLCAYEDGLVFFERVGARRGDYNSRLAKMMDKAGEAKGLCKALGFTIEYVESKTWQFEFGLGGKHGPPGCSEDEEYRARKKAHQKKAIELGLGNGTRITLENADAWLIAEYGWRKLKGALTHGKTQKTTREGTGILGETRTARDSL